MSNQDKKEFFEKFASHYPSGYEFDHVYGKHPDDVWQWIESKKKEWRDKLLEDFKHYVTHFRGCKDVCSTENGCFQCLYRDEFEDYILEKTNE